MQNDFHWVNLSRINSDKEIAELANSFANDGWEIKQVVLVPQRETEFFGYHFQDGDGGPFLLWHLVKPDEIFRVEVNPEQ